MKIGGLQKSTLIDYPGHVACTVFLVGCNFRCPWCYSPELVLPEKIALQPKIDEKEFFDFLKKRERILDGVVVCGGEATLSRDLSEFMAKIKERGFKVKLDTNGSNPETIRALLSGGLIDYVAMDVKAPLEARRYEEASGVKGDVKKIRKSIEMIKRSGIDYEFRTTVVPAIHEKEDIIRIARDISPAKQYYIQNFRAGKNIKASFLKLKPYSEEFLEEIRKEISDLFETCKIRH